MIINCSFPAEFDSDIYTILLYININHSTKFCSLLIEIIGGNSSNYLEKTKQIISDDNV